MTLSIEIGSNLYSWGLYALGVWVGLRLFTLLVMARLPTGRSPR